MTTLIIKRPPSTTLYTINIDDSAIFTKRLMAEWNVTVPYVSATILDLQIGDFVTIDSINYYITRLPDIEKLNNSTFRYTIVFQSVFSELQTRLNFSTDGLTEYSYTGTAEDFLTNLVALVADLGWTVGTVDTTLPQNITFTNEYCSASLARIAETFKLEYEIVGRAINLKKSVGTTTALTFEYGQGNGLYNITRQQVQDQNILTKVWGFGGTRNIGSDYRNRAKRLVFETAGKRYLTKNEDLYGTIEGQFTDDTIFPQRTGTLTGASIVFDETTPYAFNATTSYVEDSALDFDINSYILQDQEPKIVFKTGDLAGLECVIIRYDNATKRIYFNAYTDPNDSYTLPRYNEGTPIQPEIGDTYTLVDIKMPQSYIDTAETALQTATQAFLDENSVPQVVYSVALDPQYVKTIATPKVGDKVTIVDTDLGINALIRISGLDYPLTNPNKITATIADFVPYTLQERVVKQTINNKKEIKIVDKTNQELIRRNSIRQNQLKELIFDTDNYFDVDNIRPLSIDTSLLSVGVKSQDFQLSGVTIQPNFAGDANHIKVSAGTLIHNQLSITGLGSEWAISPAIDTSGLTPASAYYLYAKCSKTALTAEWILSTSRITVEQVTGYYHLLVGILFAVYENARDYDFTYGMTYINGRTVTTGRIRSVDGLNYFDLDTNQFRQGDATSSIDWNVTNPSALTIKGAIMSDVVMASRGYIDKLLSKEVATADSGARVTINETGTGENIKIYDATDVARVVIKPSAISTIASIQAGGSTESKTPTGTLTEVVTEFPTTVWGTSVTNQYSATFTTSLTGVLEIEVENITCNTSEISHLSTASTTLNIWLQKLVGASYVDIALIGSCTTPTATADLTSKIVRGLSLGTFRLRAEHIHWAYVNDGVTIEDAPEATCTSSWAYTAGSTFTITITKVSSLTEIGTDGFTSYWSANSYLHYSQDGFHIKDGNYEFNLTDIGITSYTLPTATLTDLGGVKIGSGVTITDGVISVSTDYLATSLKGSINGLAELDENGFVKNTQLPSYIDDIIEADNFAALPATGEAGKIYVTKDDNKTWRWGGSVYVQMYAGIALGETSATAYRGDRGKIAYDYSQIGHIENQFSSAQSANMWISGSIRSSVSYLSSAYENNIVQYQSANGVYNIDLNGVKNLLTITTAGEASFASSVSGAKGIFATLVIPTSATLASGEVGLYTTESGFVGEVPSGAGSVTSIALTVPTGLAVTGSPITESGTFAISYAAGYQMMTTAQSSKLEGIAANANNYSLPTATDTVLGGVKIGSNITITDGVISVAAPYSLPTATASVLGGVKIGSGVTITDGVISVSTDYLATNEKAADSDLLDGHDTAYFQTALTNPVTGTGTSGYLPKFSGTSAIGDSGIYTDGTKIGIGTTTLSAIVNISAETCTPRIIWTNTANYGSLYFYENTSAKGGLQVIGSASNLISRRNGLEIFTVNGAISFSSNDMETISLSITTDDKVSMTENINTNLRIPKVAPTSPTANEYYFYIVE